MYKNVSKGITYYRYKHPITGKFHGLGSNKAKALAAARKLNSILVRDNADSSVIKILGLNDKTISSLTDRYLLEHVPNLNLADGTLDNLRYRLNRIKDDLGDILIAEFSTLECASWLDNNFNKDPYIKHRGTLIDLMRFAITKGYRKDNPAEPTYSKQNITKERQRMTLEQYKAIHSAAPVWIQCAMEIALMTLQSRNEVCSMRYEDIKDGHLHVVRQKSQSKEWSRLRIAVTPQLENIIKRTRESGIASPFIIHRRPERIRKSKALKHWSQIRPDYLGKQFQKIRDSLPIFLSIPIEQRPTFHEIRSLGSWLYSKNDFEKEYVQRLMAHGDVAMTEYYQSGHDKNEKWVVVEAGLNIEKILD